MVVVMGVSGSGKTTVGTLLATQMGAPFADADDFHPAANKAKMAAGHALDDNDREPWLQHLNGMLRRWLASGQGGVLACSALKEKYRATLVGAMPVGAVTFVLLEGSRETIAERLALREHEYMSPKLLDSQIAALEVPSNALCVSNEGTPEQSVALILAQLKLSA